MEGTNIPISSRPLQLAAFNRLLDILDDLREKCPWDRKQTMGSLRHLTIEETYELADAILQEDLPEVKKELGDVMLHLLFYAKIASEQGQFDIADVLNTQCDKLIYRHPHIYGDTKAETEEDVKKNWEQLKLREGNKSVFSGVPSSLPSLVKAMRIQEKARGVGFDWDSQSQVWEKVEEELGEFKAEFNKPELTEEEKNRATDELGDVFFSLINFARFQGLNPDEALEKTNLKFIHRFKYIEQAAMQQGKKLNEMSLSEMDLLWNEAKKQ